MRIPTLEKIIICNCVCSLNRTRYSIIRVANATQMWKFPKYSTNNFSKFSSLHENRSSAINVHRTVHRNGFHMHVCDQFINTFLALELTIDNPFISLNPAASCSIPGEIGFVLVSIYAFIGSGVLIISYPYSITANFRLQEIANLRYTDDELTDE